MKKFALGILAGSLITGAASALAQVYVEATGQGVMKGYIVQDGRGREVCRDPTVYLQFRGPASYIICE